MAAGRSGIFLNGSYGVGKTSVLDHLGDRFAEAELPFALFDVDWFHRSWPVAEGDPRNVLVEAENLRAVWHNYQRSGPKTPIIAGVIETVQDQERYEECFGVELFVVHLTASPEVAAERLRGRYPAARNHALNWHLDNHQALAARLGDESPHDAVIDTDDMTPERVASVVFGTFTSRTCA
ncbi:AAA family ATPase [Arthrobacter sp. RAF14]|uniref:AAA family ATPase n=1 Tax=Arthrobacter sp. RAF14 TaxID=3233051 RepID=UPI003F919995